MASSDSEPEVKPKSKGRQPKKVVEESGSDAEPVKKGKSKDSPVKRKRKSESGAEKPKAAKKPRASKSKAVVDSGDEDEDVKPSSKAKPKATPKAKPKKEPTPPDDVMDLDSELSEPDEQDVPAKAAKKERKRKQTVVIKSREFIEDSDDENEGLKAPAPSTSKPKPTPAKAPRKSKASKSKSTDANGAEDDSALRSESEISVLLDNKSSPVKEKEKGTSGRGKKSEGKEPKSKKPRGKELSKDEEAIKRLKSFVVACGVRKAWSKEFKDMPNPSQQITHLRKILTELGMGSRPSLEQARAIKVRRELAQELEDVQEFDAVVNAPRKGRAAAPRHSLAEPGGAADAKSEDEGEDEDEDEAGDKNPAPRRKSAFGFLACQSSDDE